jgi:NADPH:quinone reductase-like Zn-dependent oxidoreductase
VSGYSVRGAPYGGFQKYVFVPQHAFAELPEEISLHAGVVLPLGISTASAGLYQKDYLALPLPSSDASFTPRKSLGRTIVIWGGSSSVGSCAIQLAVASGADVITTASRSNFKYCRDLGASEVYDYHDSNVEDQIVESLDGKTLAGVFHAVGSNGAVETCARIADRSNGKAILATIGGAPKEGVPSSVRIKQIAAGNIFNNEVGPYIWRHYLPKALAQGALVPKPNPLIVGNGLRSVQHGLDKQKAGVSAAKVVIDNINGDASSENLPWPQIQVEWLDLHCAARTQGPGSCH